MGYLNPSSWFAPKEGAVAPNVGDAVFDPTTGLYFNRRTGQYSTDAGGSQVVSSPNLLNQAARNIAIANGLQSRYSQLGQRYDAAYGAQGGFVNDLNGVINGTAAPGVAQTQLQQGLGQIAAQQQSQASGTQGVNAAIARQMAMQNTAQAQAQANQQAALIRAQEVAAARAEKGNVLGQQVQSAGQMATATGQQEVAQSGLAGSARSGYESGAREDAKTDLDFYSNAAKGVGSALATGGVKPPTSDKRAKKNVKAASPDKVKAFGKALTAVSYKYKDPEEDGEGPHMGVMAQDLLKSSIGKKMVTKGGGKYKLDPSNVVGGSLAVMKSILSRLDKLEKRRAA